jgi:hypothetical protein
MMQLQDHLVNDSSDFSNEDFQDVGEFGKSAPVWSRSMCYGYNEGRLVIVVHISLGRVQSEPCEFCATFYSAKQEIDGGGNEDQLVIWRREAKLPFTDIGDDEIKQAVLVDIIEVGKNPEQRKELSVRSIVGLRSLNSCLRPNTKRIQSALPLSGKRSGIIRDGELERFDIGWRIGAAISDCRSIDEIVQDGTQVVNAIAREKSKPVEGRPLVNVHDEPVALALGVTLFRDNIGLRFLPRDQLPLNSVEVFFGSAKFQQGASKFRRDHAIA